MITFGLTGGICCGKSTVTKSLNANNIPTVDADIVARQVVEPGTPGLSAIVHTFGSSYLLSNGTLDRAKLAKLVFSDPYQMVSLNEIMAPLIQEESNNQIKALHDAGNRIVGYDGALICEMGNADKFRPLIVVSCPHEVQLERLMKRNALSQEEAMARIAAQMPVEQKVAMADYVIDTSGTIENSIEQTKKIIHYLHCLKFQQMLDSGEMTYSQVPYPMRQGDSPDD